MKTSLNIAARSAQFIRAAVKDIRADSLPLLQGLRDNALDTLDATAHELEQYSRGFDDSQADGATDHTV